MVLDGDGPRYGQVYRALRAAILDARFPAGTRLPATRILASELRVSRTTILMAYEQLIAEGYAAGRAGSGTYVQAGVVVSTPLPAARAARPVRLGPLGESLLASRRLPLESGYLTRRAPLPWDFRYGMRSLSDFPLESWQRCLGRTARRAGQRVFDYGPPQGAPALRTALADYLGRVRGVRCAAEQIVIVTGSQQAFDLAARVLLGTGEAVVVEEPGYEGARRAMELAGARVTAVAVDDAGLDTASLPPARLAIVTPGHQYPLGGVMSWSRRAAILEWARGADAWIIEDDYDGEYRFDGPPLPPLKALDAEQRVLYLGTFSKVMFPALRIGYLVLPPALVDVFARAKLVADGGSPQLEQLALADFIARGAFARHVRRSRAQAAARRTALMDAIAMHLGDRVVVSGANAGLHVVVWLPRVRGRLTGQIARRAAEAGVGIYPVTPYYTVSPRRAGFILGYGSMPLRDIPRGIAHFAAVLDALALP